MAVPKVRARHLAPVALLASVLLAFDFNPIPVPPLPMRNAEGKGPERIKRVPIPEDFVGLALADLARVPPEEWAYTRWLAVRDGEGDSWRIANLTLAHVNRNVFFEKCVVVPGSQGHLLRVYLPLLGTSYEDTIELLKLWEEFSFDPDYALLVTKDTVDLAEIPRELLPKRTIKVVEKVDGEWQTVEHEEPFDDVIRLNPAHINPAAFARLQELTGSLAPVVNDRYFERRALRTIKDAKVYKAVFGGLYYDLRGIRKSKDPKVTDLDLFFIDMGVGHKGENVEQLFDRIKTEQATAIQHSLVTGKPREALMFQTPFTRETSSWGAITGDINDEDIDIGDHPLNNLLRVRRKAREYIFPGPTGIPRYGLANGDGARADEVPPTVAHDTTIPNPHTKRLEPPISCMRCHGNEGSNGWKDMPNDAKAQVDDRFAPLADKNQLKVNFDVRSRLAGKYGGNFDLHLRIARDHLALSYQKVMGPWPSLKDQQGIIKEATLRLQKQDDEYTYETVNRRKALYELGFDVPDSKAAAFAEWLLQPDPAAQIGDVLLEDWRIKAVRENRPINRPEWALVYSFAMDRARRRILAGGLEKWLTE